MPLIMQALGTSAVPVHVSCNTRHQGHALCLRDFTHCASGDQATTKTQPLCPCSQTRHAHVLSAS